MKTDEYLRWKVLSLKAHNENEGMTEMLLGDNPPPEIEMHTRNLCAQISHELFGEVENYCGMLNISKRRFVEQAIIELLDQTKAVFDEIEPFERLDKEGV